MKKISLQHPYKIAELAGGKVQSESLSGKRQAVGDITFTGQPTAADTFSLNGVAFTARASGAAGNEFNISGVNLSGTIDAMVTALNASVVAAVAKATYSNVGGTKLHVVFDAYGEVGNAFTLAEVSSAASVSAATLTGGSDADPVNLDAETKALSTAAGSTVSEFDLPSGDEGQETTLYLATKGAGSNAQVNGAFVGPTTKLTFDTVGEFAKLKFMGGTWYPLTNTGALS